MKTTDSTTTVTRTRTVQAISEASLLADRFNVVPPLEVMTRCVFTYVTRTTEVQMYITTTGTPKSTTCLVPAKLPKTCRETWLNPETLKDLWPQDPIMWTFRRPLLIMPPNVLQARNMCLNMGRMSMIRLYRLTVRTGT